MYRLFFLPLCLFFTWLGVYSHDLFWALLSMAMYFTIGGFCMDYTKSVTYEKNSDIFKRHGISSSYNIRVNFSFRDFLALLICFGIGQLLFQMFNGRLISFIISLVPWALGLEVATWPHKKVGAYIGREKFLGFDWPQWLDESLGLSTPGLMPNSSDEKRKGYALEVIGRLKQYPGCRMVLNGLREDNSGNFFSFKIDLSKYGEAEAERSINRFFASFGDGKIKVSFYTSGGEHLETLDFEGTTPPLE